MAVMPLVVRRLGDTSVVLSEQTTNWLWQPEL